MIARVGGFLLWCFYRAWACFRPSDRIVLGGDLYMRRFYLRGEPNGSGPSLRLQHIVRADKDRTLHNHPWDYAESRILRGWYREKRQACYWPRTTTEQRGPETLHRRAPGTRNVLRSDYFYEDIHRIVAVSPGGVWTLFRTSARHGRGWGMR